MYSYSSSFNVKGVQLQSLVICSFVSCGVKKYHEKSIDIRENISHCNLSYLYAFTIFTQYFDVFHGAFYIKHNYQVDFGRLFSMKWNGEQQNTCKANAYTKLICSTNKQEEKSVHFNRYVCLRGVKIIEYKNEFKPDHNDHTLN